MTAIDAKFAEKVYKEMNEAVQDKESDFVKGLRTMTDNADWRELVTERIRSFSTHDIASALKRADLREIADALEIELLISGDGPKGKAVRRFLLTTALAFFWWGYKLHQAESEVSKLENLNAGESV